MLRPATPLTIILFCAFVLLLISALSAPVVRGIPLARWRNYNFGVLGFCQDNGPCSAPRIGYTTDGIFAPGETPFNLPTSARHSLSSLLVVHPVAAFMALVMLALAAAAHFHGPSHSPRYLLALLILTLPTLLITLLAFLVDILLFIPQLAWGGWICLAATILIVISGICLCAMRRTLVSRKARRKRIQESKIIPLGGIAVGEELLTLADAEMSGENFYNRQRDQEAKFGAVPTPISDESSAPLVNGAPGADRLPAHAAYEYHNEQPQQQQSREIASSASDENRYYGSAYSGPTLNNSPGAPLNPYHGPGQGPSPEAVYPPPNFSRGRGGFIRGRGGPRPYGRGGPPRGPPGGFQGRGGYGPGMRAGYRGRGGPMMPPGGGMVPMGQRAPPGYPPPQQVPGGPQYPQDQPEYAQPVSPSGYGPTAPAVAAFQPHESHEHRSGPVNSHEEPYSGRRESIDTQGLVRAESPPNISPIEQGHEPGPMIQSTSHVSDHSSVSQEQPTHGPRQEQYIPARAGWDSSQQGRPRGTSVVSQGSSHYYEDVPNKFAEEVPVAMPSRAEPVRASAVQTANPQNGHPPPVPDSFGEERAGARSPATSEQSAWTSISQRPVNPNWRPGHGGEFHSLGPAKGHSQSQARQDMILSNNPDFTLPSMGVRGGGRSRGGYRAYAAPPPMPAPGLNMDADSRYPEPAVVTSREI